MTDQEFNKIRNKITKTLRDHAAVAPATTYGLLPLKELQGKLYEAFVLAQICENLVVDEKLTLEFKIGSVLVLKQKGGLIDRTYPFFKLFRDGKIMGEMFTDIEFLTMSYAHKPAAPFPRYGDYHELDIAIVSHLAMGRPSHKQVYMAVECKFTDVEKHIIREVLGYRRELSLLSPDPQRTKFLHWPAAEVNVSPPSVQMLYSKDKNLLRYTENCKSYSINLVHYEMK